MTKDFHTPRLSQEDLALVQWVGSQLRRIIQGSAFESRDFNRRDELGILANLVNRVAKELANSRLRDQRQREEIETRLAELQSAYETQERLLSTIRDISTPTLSIYNGILLLPIVGAIDSGRAMQLINNLLERVSATKAHVVILDITGSPAFDTRVADTLLQAAQAVSLLGAKVILCGMSPEVAQVVVSLDIDLSILTPSSDLQAALTTALRLTNRRITQLEG